jgi:hypothetical protein
MRFEDPTDRDYPQGDRNGGNRCGQKSDGQGGRAVGFGEPFPDQGAAECRQDRHRHRDPGPDERRKPDR